MVQRQFSMYCYVSFTRTVSVTVPVTVLHCVNGDGPFDGQIGFGTHSVRQCKFDGDGTCKRILHSIKLSFTSLVSTTAACYSIIGRYGWYLGKITFVSRGKDPIWYSEGEGVCCEGEDVRQPVTRVWGAWDRVSVAVREEEGVKDVVECLRRLGRVWGLGRARDRCRQQRTWLGGWGWGRVRGCGLSLTCMYNNTE